MITVFDLDNQHTDQFPAAVPEYRKHRVPGNVSAKLLNNVVVAGVRGDRVYSLWQLQPPVNRQFQFLLATVEQIHRTPFLPDDAHKLFEDVV